MRMRVGPARSGPPLPPHPPLAKLGVDLALGVGESVVRVLIPVEDAHVPTARGPQPAALVLAWAQGDHHVAFPQLEAVLPIIRFKEERVANRS